MDKIQIVTDLPIVRWVIYSIICAVGFRMLYILFLHRHLLFDMQTRNYWYWIIVVICSVFLIFKESPESWWSCESEEECGAFYFGFLNMLKCILQGVHDFETKVWGYGTSSSLAPEALLRK